jgi:hypothetical protein
MCNVRLALVLVIFAALHTKTSVFVRCILVFIFEYERPRRAHSPSINNEDASDAHVRCDALLKAARMPRLRVQNCIIAQGSEIGTVHFF